MASQMIKGLAFISLLGLVGGRLVANEPAPAPAAEAPAPAAAECKKHDNHKHQHGEKCGHKAHQHKGADGTEHTCYMHGKHHHMVHGEHTDECEHKS